MYESENQITFVALGLYMFIVVFKGDTLRFCPHKSGQIFIYLEYHSWVSPWDKLSCLDGSYSLFLFLEELPN